MPEPACVCGSENKNFFTVFLSFVFVSLVSINIRMYRCTLTNGFHKTFFSFSFFSVTQMVFGLHFINYFVDQCVFCIDYNEIKILKMKNKMFVIYLYEILNKNLINRRPLMCVYRIYMLIFCVPFRLYNKL